MKIKKKNMTGAIKRHILALAHNGTSWTAIRHIVLDRYGRRYSTSQWKAIRRLHETGDGFERLKKAEDAARRAYKVKMAKEGKKVTAARGAITHKESRDRALVEARHLESRLDTALESIRGHSPLELEMYQSPAPVTGYETASLATLQKIAEVARKVPAEKRDASKPFNGQLTLEKNLREILLDLTLVLLDRSELNERPAPTMDRTIAIGEILMRAASNPSSISEPSSLAFSDLLIEVIAEVYEAGRAAGTEEV